MILAVIIAVTGIGYGLIVDPVGSAIGLGLALILLFGMRMFAVDSAVGGLLGAGHQATDVEASGRVHPCDADSRDA